MADKAKIDGVAITLAGEAYTLPPLPLARMPKIKTLMNGGDSMSEEFVNALVDAIWWSLQRNYPDIVREAVSDNVDLKNWKIVLDAFMNTNGFAPVAGAQPSGEAQAATSTT